MVAILIALAPTIFFLVILAGLCVSIQKNLKLYKKNPSIRIAFLWLFVLGLPNLLVWLWAPAANNVFLSFPVLQSSAWDVGLAMNLYIGKFLSYFVGILVATIYSLNLFLTKARGRKIAT